MKDQSTTENATSPMLRREFRSRLTFKTGLLAGAAVSTLIPWEALESVAPGARLAFVALLCATFITFRLVFARAEALKAISIAMVAAGGLLMSAGAKMVPGSLVVSPVAVGAACFLFGITLLMRERHLPSRLRAEAVGRLLEDTDGSAADDDAAVEAQASKTVERLRSLQLLAETQAQQPRPNERVGF